MPAMKGKRVLMVPMAMGFDLAQGWAYYIGKEVKGFGGTFETRDPNWSVEAGAQAITEPISADPKPAVLVVHSPDLNSYGKLFKKAQAEGIYVILIDNPTNFAADAFVGTDWDKLGQLEAEAVVKGCGARSTKKIGLVQGDQVNASSLYQYAGIMKVLEKHPDFKVVAKPDSDWDATTARNVTTTMLQQHPDICAIIDFWDGDATGTSAAIRDAGKEGKIFLVTTGGGEKVDCDKLESRHLRGGRHDRAAEPVARHQRDHQVPAAERPAGRHLEDLHLHAGEGDHEGRHQAGHLLGPEGAAGGREVGISLTGQGKRPAARRPLPAFSTTQSALRRQGFMSLRERVQRLRYNYVPDHLIGEILTKRWADNAIPFLALVITVVGFGTAIPGFFRPQSLSDSTRQLGEFSIVVTGLTIVMLGGGIDLSVGSIFALSAFAAVSTVFIFAWPVWAACCGDRDRHRLRRSQRLPHRLYAPARLPDDVGHPGLRPRPLRHPRRQFRRPDPDVEHVLGCLGLHRRRHGLRAVDQRDPRDRDRHRRPCRADPLAHRLAHPGGRRLAPLGPQCRHPVRGTVFLTYVISGVCCGVAGFLIACRLSGAGPGTGLNLEIMALTAAVVGGNSLGGGRGSIVKGVMGAVIVLVMTNGLIRLGYGTGTNQMVLGLMLAAAVTLDIRWLKNRHKVLNEVYVAPIYHRMGAALSALPGSGTPYALDDRHLRGRDDRARRGSKAPRTSSSTATTTSIAARGMARSSASSRPTTSARRSSPIPAASRSASPSTATARSSPASARWASIRSPRTAR